MHSGKTVQIIFCIGFLLSFFQLIFGVFSFLFTQFQGTESILFVHADQLTSSGAMASLRTFSTSSALAGLLSLILSCAAWLLHGFRKSSVLTGLLLIFAGAANSVILFSAGLPVGIILMAAGIIFLMENQHRTSSGNDSR